MKVFQHYNPLKIATYVKILFKGHLYIKDLGIFEFDMGRVLPPKVQDKQYLQAMSEINRKILQLQRLQEEL